MEAPQTPGNKPGLEVDETAIRSTIRPLVVRRSRPFVRPIVQQINHSMNSEQSQMHVRELEHFKD